LERAALALYCERGFEQTTVAEIAERAGLTERTFFRHFADKREVLFSGASALEGLLTGVVADAPEGATPFDAVSLAFVAAGSGIQERRDFAVQRQIVIASSAELQERELIKLASLSVAIAHALEHRGVDVTTASLTGEVGVAVFKVAFERWVNEGPTHDLGDVVRSCFDELRVVTLGS
jgi:AcrR family transcriptional regulator